MKVRSVGYGCTVMGNQEDLPSSLPKAHCIVLAVVICCSSHLKQFTAMCFSSVSVKDARDRTGKQHKSTRFAHMSY